MHTGFSLAPHFCNTICFNQESHKYISIHDEKNNLLRKIMAHVSWPTLSTRTGEISSPSLALSWPMHSWQMILLARGSPLQTLPCLERQWVLCRFIHLLNLFSACSLQLVMWSAHLGATENHLSDNFIESKYTV